MFILITFSTVTPQTFTFNLPKGARLLPPVYVSPQSMGYQIPGSFGNYYNNPYGNNYGNSYGNYYNSPYGNSYGNSYGSYRPNYQYGFNPTIPNNYGMMGYIQNYGSQYIPNSGYGNYRNYGNYGLGNYGNYGNYNNDYSNYLGMPYGNSQYGFSPYGNSSYGFSPRSSFTSMNPYGNFYNSQQATSNNLNALKNLIQRTIIDPNNRLRSRRGNLSFNNFARNGNCFTGNNNNGFSFAFPSNNGFFAGGGGGGGGGFGYGFGGFGNFRNFSNSGNLSSIFNGFSNTGFNPSVTAGGGFNSQFSNFSDPNQSTFDLGQNILGNLQTTLQGNSFDPVSAQFDAVNRLTSNIKQFLQNPTIVPQYQAVLPHIHSPMNIMNFNGVPFKVNRIYDFNLLNQSFNEFENGINPSSAPEEAANSILLRINIPIKLQQNQISQSNQEAPRNLSNA